MKLKNFISNKNRGWTTTEIIPLTGPVKGPNEQTQSTAAQSHSN